MMVHNVFIVIKDVVLVNTLQVFVPHALLTLYFSQKVLVVVVLGIKNLILSVFNIQEIAVKASTTTVMILVCPVAIIVLNVVMKLVYVLNVKIYLS